VTVNTVKIFLGIKQYIMIKNNIETKISCFWEVSKRGIQSTVSIAKPLRFRLDFLLLHFTKGALMIKGRGIPLLMATMNPHKIREVESILSEAGMPSGWQLHHMGDVGFHGDIPEDEATLEGNARSKSVFAHGLTGMNSFADDTGLEVEALGGIPGVHSARFAGEPVDSSANIRKLLSMLEGVSDRRARFRTVICLLYNGTEYFFEGIAEGEILHTPQGVQGFGYDPVFKPNGYACSFAEMDSTLKNNISHRFHAVTRLGNFLKKIDQP
jgi:XTP/dITP diphosphohydrolase